MKHPVPEPDQIKYYKHHVLLERFKDYIKEICMHDKVNNNALLKLCNVCIMLSLDVVWIPSIFKNLEIICVISKHYVNNYSNSILNSWQWYFNILSWSWLRVATHEFQTTIYVFLISALYVLYLIAINEVVAATHHIISHLFKTFLRYSIWSAKRKSL